MAATGPDALLLLEALRFAAVKHRDQRRRDPHASPFINHVIDIVYVLMRVGGVSDTGTLLGAILHDVLDDSRTKPAEIEQRFGADVLALIGEVTDNRALPKDERRKRQLARAATASQRARLIEIADKIANLHTLPMHWSQTEREDYVDFTERIGAALRGANAQLDALLAETLRRARAALRESPGYPPALRRPPTSPADPADNPAEVDRLLQRLQRMLGDAEELADSIVACRGFDGNGLRRLPETLVSPAVAASHKTAPRRRHSLDPKLRILAEPGVGAIEVHPRGERSALVSIDDAHAFPIPRGLAHLLSLIASPDGRSEDECVPFKTLPELAHKLAGLEGWGDWNTHRVTAAVSRLRNVLEKRGRVNPWLVETCRQRGVRFRLRRRPGRD